MGLTLHACIVLYSALYVCVERARFGRGKHRVHRATYSTVVVVKSSSTTGRWCKANDSSRRRQAVTGAMTSANCSNINTGIFAHCTPMHLKWRSFLPWCRFHTRIGSTSTTYRYVVDEHLGSARSFLRNVSHKFLRTIRLSACHIANLHASGAFRLDLATEHDVCLSMCVCATILSGRGDWDKSQTPRGAEKTP